MAITRKLNEIVIRFGVTGIVSVDATVIVKDSDENTETGMTKHFNANQVENAASVLRDEVVEQFAGQGKPVTF